jgi:hypothetical protein
MVQAERSGRRWMPCCTTLDATGLLTDGIPQFGTPVQLGPLNTFNKWWVCCYSPPVLTGTPPRQPLGMRVEGLYCKICDAGFGAPAQGYFFSTTSGPPNITSVSNIPGAVPVLQAGGGAPLTGGLTLPAAVTSAVAIPGGIGTVTTPATPTIFTASVDPGGQFVTPGGGVDLTTITPVPTINIDGGFGIGFNFTVQLVLALYVSKYVVSTNRWTIRDPYNVTSQDLVEDYLDFVADAYSMSQGAGWPIHGRSWMLKLPHPVRLDPGEALVVSVTASNYCQQTAIIPFIRTAVSVMG